jgi:hypothetical protein
MMAQLSFYGLMTLRSGSYTYNEAPMSMVDMVGSVIVLSLHMYLLLIATRGVYHSK